MFARSSTKSMAPVSIFSLAGHVVVVGQHVRAAGDVEDLLVPAGDPVPAVRVAPGDRALAVQVIGDLLEVVPVIWRVPVVVVALGLPGRLAEVGDCHVVSPFVASVRRG
jgi:hypothetical protein